MSDSTNKLKIPAQKNDLPWVDNRILSWMMSICTDMAAWTIHSRIRYWERKNKPCYDKPAQLITLFGISRDAFFRAVRRGETAGMFERLGKSKSHMSRGWRTLVYLKGFDEDGMPEIAKKDRKTTVAKPPLNSGTSATVTVAKPPLTSGKTATLIEREY